MSTCQGHARCCVLAPQVFSLDETGALFYLVAPDAMTRPVVEDAMDSCPTQSISLEA